MDKIKQKTPKHEGETCGKTVIKQQLKQLLINIVLAIKF